MINKTRLNYQDRQYLYKTLKSKENFQIRIEEKKGTVRKIMRELITKYMFDSETLNFYKNARRILNTKNNMIINLEDIGLCEENSDKIYPNEMAPKILTPEEKQYMVPIRMEYFFSLNVDGEDKIIIPRNGWKDTVHVELDVSRVPQVELEILRNALLELNDVLFEQENFLRKYWKNQEFFGGFSSMASLKSESEEWYDIVMEQYIENNQQISTNTTSKDEKFPPNNIKTSLENLKSMIEEMKMIKL